MKGLRYSPLHVTEFPGEMQGKFKCGLARLIRQLLSYMATLEELLFGAKLEAWRRKMFHIFHFLQCEMVLGIVNPL